MESFDSTIETFLNPQDPGGLPLPGGTFGAVNRLGTFTYVKSFGDAAHEGGPEPLYTFASSTKPITAIAALQCVEKGLLDLDEDISRVLPEWKDPKILTGVDDSGQPISYPAKSFITLRQLLTHSSGMSYPSFSPVLRKYREAKGLTGNQTIEELFPTFLTHEPGEKWVYAPGIDWAGKMVERVNNNTKLGAYMQHHIFAPLGLKDMTFHLDAHRDQTQQQRARLAKTWRRGPDGTLRTIANPCVPDPVAEDFGGSGLYVSAPDVLKLWAAVLREDQRLLSRDSIRQLFAPQLETPRGLEALQNTDPAALCGLPTSVGLNWGLGGLVNLEAVEGRRGRDSFSWSGMPNCFFWIDFPRGVAGVQLLHVMPCGDERTVELFNRFEEAVYEAVKGFE